MVVRTCYLAPPGLFSYPEGGGRGGWWSPELFFQLFFLQCTVLVEQFEQVFEQI